MEDFFKNFLRMKTAHRDYNKEFLLRASDSMSMALGLQWPTEAATRIILLGLFDLRNIAYALSKEGNTAKHDMKNLMVKVMLLSKPAYTSPIVLVWIVNGTVVKKLEKLKALI